MANTLVEYVYRDGSNYKQRREVVLEGEVTEQERASIASALVERELFLPAQVGLDVLYTQWPTHYEDDHAWHELCTVELTSRRAFHHEDVHQFASRFTDVQWDVDAATKDLQVWVSQTPHGR